VDFFFHFLPSKIRISSIDVVSSLSSPQCRFSSGRHRHAAAPCHASSPLSQDVLVASASSFGNTLFRRLPSRAEIKALNPYHHRRLPSPNRLTPTCSTAIKSHLILGHSPHHSTTSLFYLLPSQSTTSSELRTYSSFPFTAVSRPSCLCTTTPTVTN
jgi:hypothetical protein